MNVLVVYKKSKYELYRDSKDEKIRQFMAQDQSVSVMKKSHFRQNDSLAYLLDTIYKMNFDFDVIYRADLKPVENKDLVIAVGGDGTVLEVSHYLKDVPVLGYNSDPGTSVGFLCCCDMVDVKHVLEGLDDYPKTKLKRLEVSIDDKIIPELVLNDLRYCHQNPAATTSFKMNKKKYKNCGLLVSTSAGSTAWMWSENGYIFDLNLNCFQYKLMGQRNAKHLFNNHLGVKSFTRQGKIYIDGPHLSYECGLGQELEIKMVEPLNLVGDLCGKRKLHLSY